MVSKLKTNSNTPGPAGKRRLQNSWRTNPQAAFAMTALLCGLQFASGGTSFIAGADMSLVPFFEGRGITYRDNGQVQDAFTIIRQHGINCVRLRLFTSSAAQAQADAYDYTNNLTYTLPLAVRVKNAGLQFMLDFHYSDTWADPGKQAKPQAWTNLTSAQLVQQMHDYNSNCIATFAAAGAMPDYVQIGNEITPGLLWTNGEVGGSYNTAAQWSQLGQLLKAAVQGIKDASGTQMPKIIVHIDRGGDWATTQWFFDNLLSQAVPFDIIGESYYPFWHGDLGALANCLTNAAKRYGKPVLIAETAFPWTNTVWSTNIYGLPPTVAGQQQYVAALAPIVRSIPSGLGVGVVWWGTEYQQVNGVNEAGFNTASFFDTGGNLLPAASALGQLAAPLRLNAGLSGSQLSLAWPLSGAAFSLMTTSNLAPLSQWVPVTNLPQTSGTGISVTLPLDGAPTHFYRLQGN